MFKDDSINLTYKKLPPLAGRNKWQVCVRATGVRCERLAVVVRR